MRLSFLLAAMFSLNAAAPGSGVSSFEVEETGRSYDRLGDAVASIGSRTGTILIAPGSYRQCAVQQEGKVTYRARTVGTAIFDGAICEGKAALVLRGQSAIVDGLTFQNLRVPDGNGAGIRLERGNLDVLSSVFRDSEEGILTHDDAASTIRIDHSTFRRLGRCDRDLDCAHGIYVGHYGTLSVTASRFEAGNGGHYVKSRSERVSIVGNSFDDSAGHLTNYMIDLSNGSAGSIARNEMVQGRDKDNFSAFITIAPEGRERDSSSLSIAGNSASFAPGVSRQSTFVANWTNDAVQIGANRLAPGINVTDRR